MGFWIEVGTLGGVRLFNIRTATAYSITRRMDRAGDFSFSMPASDTRSASLQLKYRVACYSIQGGAIVEIGSGIINRIRRGVDTSGQVMLDISGPDYLSELSHRQIGALTIDDGSGGVVTDGIQDLIALAPSPWSLDTVNGYDVTAKAILHTFEPGETVLAGFIKLAELTGEHFRAGSGRKVIWLKNDRTSTGIRAIVPADPDAVIGNEDIAVILSMEQIDDGNEIFTRVYPYGKSGLTLSGATWSPPAGYEIDTAGNWIRSVALETTYTQIDKYLKADDIEDANMLAEACHVLLEQRGSEYKCYTVTITNVEKPIYPGQTIHVVYRKFIDGVEVWSVDDVFIILESTAQFDQGGLRTYRLSIANLDRYPTTDESVIADAIKKMR